MIDNLKEETQGNVEDAFAVDDELPFNMDDIEVPENEEKAEFVEMLMNVMHAAITIYLAINYWYTYALDLFGGEISSNAADFFASGLKGRFGAMFG